MLLLVSCVGNETLSIATRGAVQSVYVETDVGIIGVGESANITIESTGNYFDSIEAADILISTSGGSSVGVFSGLTKNLDNTFSVTFTGTESGTQTLVAISVKGGAVNTKEPRYIRVTPGDYSLTNSLVGVDSVAPGAGTSVNITVNTFDTSGAAFTVGGLVVRCTGETSGTTVSASTAIDNGNGTYSATIVAKDASAVTTVACKINNQSIVDTATFTTVAGDGTRLSIKSGNNQSAAVNTPLTKYVVTLTDAYGNAVFGETINWSVAYWSGEGSAGNLNVFSSISNPNGDAEVTHTLGTNTGLAYISASLDGTPSVITYFSATAIAGAAASLEIISGNSQSGQMGGGLAEPLKVLVKDSEGNPVADETISFALTSGGGTLILNPVSGNVTSDSEGIATVDVTSYSDIESITIEADGASTAPVAFNDLTFTVGQPSTISITQGNNQTEQTKTDLPLSFEIEVRDVFGNLLSDVPLEWTVNDGGGSFPDGAQALTAADGTAEAVFRNGNAAGYFTVTVASQNVPSVSATFTVLSTEGTPDELALDSGDNQEVLFGETSEKLTVQLRDEQDVPLEGKTIRWTVDAGHTIVASSPVTDENGESWVQIKVSNTTAGDFNAKAEYLAAALEYEFSLEVTYHHIAVSYFDRVARAPDFGDVQKREISDLASKLDDLGVIAGGNPNANEIWIMRSKYNKGTGAEVFGLLGESSITLRNYNISQWTDSVNDNNKYGICFNSTNQYGTTTSSTRDSSYLARSVMVIVQMFTKVGGESFIQTSNKDFDDGINQPGEGFRIGREAGWGADNNKNWDAETDPGDFVNMDIDSRITLAKPTAIHSQIYGDDTTTYINGGKNNTSLDVVSGTVDVGSFMGDSKSISIARKDLNTGAGARGFDGCMPFAMHMNNGYSADLVDAVYQAIKETIGSDLELP